jgi:PKD repeat protein
MKRLSILCVLTLALGGCGGGGGSSAPTTPTQTTTPAVNRAPAITAASVNPGWGISTLTTHVFTSSATDPDGDAITYSWDFGNGTAGTSADGSVVYNNADTNAYQATLTVRDSKGMSTSTTVSVASVTMAGTWAGTLGGAPLTATLTQFIGGFVSGTWQQPSRGFSGDVGPSGELGKIQANGQFEMRFKVRQGSFTDFYYRGTINPTGQQLTGALQGSGFTGEIMILDKR